MPVKRRVSKRRASPEAECKAWTIVFLSGHDFLGDLEDFGFPTGPEGDAAVQAAAEEVWARLGALWLRGNWHDRKVTPWALETFGPPPGADRAD